MAKIKLRLKLPNNFTKKDLMAAIKEFKPEKIYLSQSQFKNYCKIINQRTFDVPMMYMRRPIVVV